MGGGVATLRLDTNLDIVLGCLLETHYAWLTCQSIIQIMFGFSGKRGDCERGEEGGGRSENSSSETRSQKRRINLHAKQNKLELVTRHFRGNIYVCLPNIINFFLLPNFVVLFCFRLEKMHKK